MIVQGYVFMGILVFINIACYVMIDAYFEGHPAFTDDET
jgi:hypothetical protein